MAKYYDPAKEPCEDNYSFYEDCLEDGQSSIQGPGGKTTNIENNEKGILETNLFKVINSCEYAALGSDHDSFRQGVYTTNSAGDHD